MPITRKGRKSPHRKTSKNRMQSGSVAQFQAVLKQKYPNCVFDKNNHEGEYNHPITYGEVTYEGIDILQKRVFQKYLQNRNNVVFIDIGMGRGKLPLYMSANPHIVKSIGVELVKERYEDAIQLKKDILKKGKFQRFTDKVLFINGDFLKDETTKDIQELTKSNPCFIWISNLCFGNDLTNKIFDKLHDLIHRDSIVCCSVAPPHQPKFDFQEEVVIPMSWSKNSNVNIFCVK